MKYSQYFLNSRHIAMVKFFYHTCFLITFVHVSMFYNSINFKQIKMLSIVKTADILPHQDCSYNQRLVGISITYRCFRQAVFYGCHLSCLHDQRSEIAKRNRSRGYFLSKKQQHVIHVTSAECHHLPVC